MSLPLFGVWNSIFLEDWKKSCILGTLTLSGLQIIIELWKTNKKVWLGTPHVLRALCGADPEQNAGRLASPIWNNYLFSRLHAGTIHKSNPEDLPVFQAPRWDDIWVQPRTTPCFYGSMQGRFKILIKNSPWSTSRVHKLGPQVGSKSQVHKSGPWVGSLSWVHTLDPRVGVPIRVP